MPYNFKTGRHEPAREATKDYASDYARVTRADWVSDLDSLFYPLQKAILTAFRASATPMKDIETAAGQFSNAVMAVVEQGVALDMTDYLQPDDDGAMPVMYMTVADNPYRNDTKAGRAISSSNHTKLSKAADGIAEHARAIKAVLKAAAQSQGYSSQAGEQPHLQAKDEAKLEALLSEIALDLTIRNAVRGL